MNSDQHEDQEELVKSFLKRKNINSNIVISELKKKGYDNEFCMSVLEKFDNQKRRTSAKEGISKRDKHEEKEKRGEQSKSFLDGLAVFVGIGCIIISIMGITSILSLALILIGSYFIGDRLSYYNSDTISNFVALTIFLFAFSFTYPWYVEGRTRILKIEGAIPFFLAVIPAYLIYYVLHLSKRN